MPGELLATAHSADEPSGRNVAALFRDTISCESARLILVLPRLPPYYPLGAEYLAQRAPAMMRYASVTQAVSSSPYAPTIILSTDIE